MLAILDGYARAGSTKLAAHEMRVSPRYITDVLVIVRERLGAGSTIAAYRTAVVTGRILPRD
jgi:hypothetical protein